MSSDPWSLKNRNTGKYTELPFSQHDAEAAAHHLGLGLNITPAAGVSWGLSTSAGESRAMLLPWTESHVNNWKIKTGNNFMNTWYAELSK